jgi:hypothetical protein
VQKGIILISIKNLHTHTIYQYNTTGIPEVPAKIKKQNGKQ